jgi:gamma-glutamylcyclotransferase (GGCT)/AIG2-like uncharacterized protein YtfP
LAERKVGGEFIFFYGTLLLEFVLEAMRDVVGRLLLYGEGSVRGALYDLGDYPGAVFDKASDKRVYGLVFQLPEDSQVLKALDRYEGYEPAAHGASLFVRKLVCVDLPTGGTSECWAYEYNGDPASAPVIASGRYEGPG